MQDYAVTIEVGAETSLDFPDVMGSLHDALEALGMTDVAVTSGPEGRFSVEFEFGSPSDESDAEAEAVTILDVAVSRVPDVEWTILVESIELKAVLASN